ncbi:hypothetical protein [uncultured Pseudacidovorax sp.]|uniref:hypothetical protein n=1 Tax=uncultured Pseudacidovorax sp. TaxID=679313 RepID=UPI0025E44CFE|nr:hypothetical protein [uncultured Pseudacidovorax sp.]
MSALVIGAWFGGVLVGAAFGALVMALCVAAGRADEALDMQAQAHALRGHEA